MNIQRPLAKSVAGVLTPAQWQEILKLRDTARVPEQDGYVQSFASLCQASTQVLVGQLGQSVDGRIATASGDSFYINCEEALDHLHCLRALCDAVVVGVGTVVADNPQLTVRRVEGPQATRVVIDPNGRIPLEARLLHDKAAPTIILTRKGVTINVPEHVEVRHVRPDENGRLCCEAIAAALTDYRRILIEGGACTVSRFLQAGLLSRLHVLVAPLIIGSGPTGIQLPPLNRLADAPRPAASMYQLGIDWLMDLDLQ
ncbi:RibD family protein [Pseudovibrio exalbescens]|uniref:RibD family protein n=1 Tax=Pseudovibrio exalbescens TaxID=197461 RepID=UPI000C99F31A|nr:dihydrofolate reductase family protein [Pseudovibrio exalbescens]